MTTVVLNGLETLVAGLIAFSIGKVVSRSVPVLGRIDLPVPVVGGLLVAVGLTVLRSVADIEVHFSQRITDVLLLVFFTTIGLTARFSALKAGGRPLLLLCMVTVLLILCQNVVGIGVALVNGSHPYYGLLVGSVSFVGGPGTAAAWAREASALGLGAAMEVAMGAATLAIIAGAVVSGPFTGRLVKRRNLAPAQPVVTTSAEKRPVDPIAAASSDEMMTAILLVMGSVLIGVHLNDHARSAGLVLPGFLTAMLGGVIIVNAIDLFRLPIDIAPVERGGGVALQIFLSAFLMGLKMWTLGAVIVPLLVNVVLQVLLSMAIAWYLLFPLLGRTYDAAVAAGGFLGFGLSSMPVAMASMEKVTSRFGPAPQAFLIITLAGSFFVDLANAMVVKLFLTLPFFN